MRAGHFAINSTITLSQESVTRYIEDKEDYYEEVCLMNSNVTHKEFLTQGAAALFLDFALFTYLLVPNFSVGLCLSRGFFHFFQDNLGTVNLNCNYVEFNQEPMPDSSLLGILLDDLQWEFSTQKARCL